MKLRSLGAACAALALTACAATGPLGPAPTHTPAPSQPTLPPPPPAGLLPLSVLPGWLGEDHASAFAAYRETCGASRDAALAAVCRAARARPRLGGAEARDFFEAHFVAAALPDEGVLTGYYAPVYSARRTPDTEFSAPLRPKPADLKMVDGGVFDPAQAGRPAAAIDAGFGAPLPYPDRANIEAAPPDRALAWLRPEDLYFLQIQGSGVLQFEDGVRMKAVYAANNGRTYVALAGPMRERGLLAANEVSAERIHAWLADHRGPEAQALMQLNPRYAFFSLAPDDGRPPVGAANVPLPTGRAVAVDPGFHAMGEPLWIDGQAPLLAGAFPSYRRLVVALDTGGAIRGAVRADLYLGQGPAAGTEAGRVRHTLRMYRLVPKAAP